MRFPLSALDFLTSSESSGAPYTESERLKKISLDLSFFNQRGGVHL